jgi:hypothetical protein
MHLMGQMLVLMSFIRANKEMRVLFYGKSA